jgi:hypothetical protein
MAARRPSKSSSPLDNRQRELIAKQEDLQRQMDELQSVIAAAPLKREAHARAQRDQLLVDRSSRAIHRLNSTTLADNRFDLPRSRTRRRPLKAEKRQARLFTMALLFVFAIMVIVLLHYWHLQWPS